MSLPRDATQPKISNRANYYRNKLRQLRSEEKARKKQKARGYEAFKKLKSGGN